ncbi:MAG: isochorismate synthase [Nannocystaceae bacterium]
MPGGDGFLNDLDPAGPRPVAGADAWAYLGILRGASSAFVWRSGPLALCGVDLGPEGPGAAGWPTRVGGRTFTGAPGRDEWSGWPGVLRASPRLLYVSRGDGRVFRLGEGPSTPPAEAPHPSTASPSAGAPRFMPVEAADAWQDAVRTTTAAIREGVAAKVVLARREVAELPDAITRAPALLRGLRAEHPRSSVYGLLPARELGWFIGATPETLIRRDHGWVMTEALAGTSTDGPEGLDNPKDRAEHRWVVDGIAAALEGVTHGLEALGPTPVQAGRLYHWQTRFRGRPAPGVGLLDLAERIHPSPAIGGTPRDVALAQIAALEPRDRGWYAGALGWQDGGGDGHVVVGLRSALLRGDQAWVYAGAGIVEGSDPAMEWRETAAKLAACKRALQGDGGDG